MTTLREEMMFVEHVAFLVEDVKGVTDWWCANLGMKVIRYGGPPTHMTFLQDAAGKTMFEIYQKDDLETPDYVAMHVSVLHFAFYSEDVALDRERLIAAGATAVGEVAVTEAGDHLVFVRDPFGITIQILKRKEPMV
jgi:catechol 2,3-dioxygenase-like lactoylglutathione lyase family enzyme